MKGRCHPFPVYVLDIKIPDCNCNILETQEEGIIVIRAETSGSYRSPVLQFRVSDPDLIYIGRRDNHMGAYLLRVIPFASVACNHCHKFIVPLRPAHGISLKMTGDGPHLALTVRVIPPVKIMRDVHHGLDPVTAEKDCHVFLVCIACIRPAGRAYDKFLLIICNSVHVRIFTPPVAYRPRIGAVERPVFLRRLPQRKSIAEMCPPALEKTAHDIVHQAIARAPVIAPRLDTGTGHACLPVIGEQHSGKISQHPFRFCPDIPVFSISGYISQTRRLHSGICGGIVFMYPVLPDIPGPCHEVLISFFCNLRRSHSQ